MRTTFRDNFILGNGDRKGSVAAFSADTIFVKCALSMSVEQNENGAMIVAERLVIDETKFVRVNRGAAIALLNTTELMSSTASFHQDAGFQILVRNANLNGRPP